MRRAATRLTALPHAPSSGRGRAGLGRAAVLSAVVLAWLAVFGAGTGLAAGASLTCRGTTAPATFTPAAGQTLTLTYAQTGGSCALAGTVPSGATVVVSGTAVELADGAENDGTIAFDDQANVYEDSGLYGAGTFVNRGTITIVPPGQGASLGVATLLNYGTISPQYGQIQLVRALPGGQTLPGGTLENEPGGTIDTNAAAGLYVPSSFTLKLDPGSVTDAGGNVELGSAELDVAGGTVNGSIQSIASRLTFEPGASAAPSTGKIEQVTGGVLAGTIPRGWAVSSGGGPFTLSPGSANAGTLVLDSAAPAISDPAPFTNTGTIVDQAVRSASIATPTLTNLGTIELPAGESLKLDGALSLGPSSVLQPAVDGTAAAAFGRLQVTGRATLAGTLDVVRGTTYTPAIGDTQQVLTAGSLTGRFSRTRGGNGGSFYTPVYRPTSVTLSTEQPKPPTLSALRISPRSLRPSPHGSPLSPGARGATLRYTDSAAATTRFTVYRRVTGRRGRGRCARLTPRGAGGRTCPRLVRVGSFTHRDEVGAARLHFSGRLSGHVLRAGRYALTASATLDRRTSASVHVAFAVLKAPTPVTRRRG